MQYNRQLQDYVYAHGQYFSAGNCNPGRQQIGTLASNMNEDGDALAACLLENMTATRQSQGKDGWNDSTSIAVTTLEDKLTPTDKEKENLCAVISEMNGLSGKTTDQSESSIAPDMGGIKILKDPSPSIYFSNEEKEEKEHINLPKRMTKVSRWKEHGICLENSCM